jgi:hypothetical protein
MNGECFNVVEGLANGVICSKRVCGYVLTVLWLVSCHNLGVLWVLTQFATMLY